MRDGQEEPVKDRKRRNVGVREEKRLRQREWKVSQSVNMPVSFVGKGGLSLNQMKKGTQIHQTRMRPATERNTHTQGHRGFLVFGHGGREASGVLPFHLPLH